MQQLLLLVLLNLFLLGLIVGLLIALRLALRWLLSEMANHNKFVTFRTEGELKAIMRGEKCVRWIMSVENHIIDPRDFDIAKASLDNLTPYALQLTKQGAARRKERDLTFSERKLVTNPDGSYPDRPRFTDEFKEELRIANSETWFEKQFGVVWVGFPPYHVFTYRFRWIKYGQEETASGQPSANIIMSPRDELVDSLYFHYTQYGIVIDDAKTGKGSLNELLQSKEAGAPGGNPTPQQTGREQVEVVFKLVMETETINPQKTLFRTAGLSSAGEWLSALCNTIRDVTREWTTTQSWDTIIDKQEAVRDFLQDLRAKVNEGIPVKKKDEKEPRVVSAERDYGQRVLKINLISCSLKDQSLQAQLDAIFAEKRKVLQAEQKKLAALQEAEGKQALAAADGLGRAKGYKAMAQSGGMQVAIAEAFGRGGIRVLQVGGGGGMGNLLNLPSSLTEETGSTPASENPDTTGSS
ncbi:MAG: hypothetical protein A2664_04180 [Candidatus Taylorbacteria bacterium RIFCSPHIGHO2_01_FULL_46_22b]|uniref:Band 7 domain-containing protein n=1 Tax=Candidatus Taylorbacteria bacterium RIFCSPHIGHO2_01_FULL_46_22b TaxID=1802301 RepID=A0A1G2M1Y1_9BACT|nr:MAG: hypothetical protein A2664_04180 [Candidatus Taylorbacteria bacterium RIFCSPHIGHO2_01_FULL_46_22b]